MLKGSHHTEETRKKMAKAQLGEKNHFYGNHHTEETKQKMSLSRIGYVATEETREKISLANKGRISCMKGKHHTEETRRKMSLAGMGRLGHWKGKHLTEEHRKNLSKAQLGEKNHFYGKHLSEEAKRKSSESHKGNHNGKDTEFKLDEDFLEIHGTTRTLYPYSIVFTDEFKDMIRARDGNKCVVTGLTNEEHKARYGKSLYVHHWTYDKDVTDPFYFVTVTCEINVAAETNRGEWIDLFNGVMEDNYCELMQ